MSFNNLNDFWDSFEEKEIFEAIWDIYEDLSEERKDLVKAVNKSKSIRNVPYQIKKRWKKFRFRKLENNISSLTTTGDDVLTSIPSTAEDGSPNIVNEDLEPVDIELEPVLPFDKNGETVTRDANMSVGMELAEEVDGYPVGTLITEDMSDLGEVEVRNRYVIDFEGDFEGEYINLWIKEYYIHNPLIINYHSAIVGLDDNVYNVNVYSRQFLNMIKALWYILVQGPTMHNLKIGVLLFLGLPVTLESDLTIEKWEPGFVELSNGDQWTFPESYPLISTYEYEGETYQITGEGQALPRFVPLIENIHVFDYIDDPEYEGVITSPDRKDIEKYSTLAIRIADDLFETDYVPDTSLVEKFLEGTTPQYLLFDILRNFIIRVVQNIDISTGLYMNIKEEEHFVFAATSDYFSYLNTFNGRTHFDGSANFDGEYSGANPLNHYFVDKLKMKTIFFANDQFSNQLDGTHDLSGQILLDGEGGYVDPLSHNHNIAIKHNNLLSIKNDFSTGITRYEKARFDGSQTFNGDAAFDSKGEVIHEEDL